MVFMTLNFLCCASITCSESNRILIKEITKMLLFCCHSIYRLFKYSGRNPVTCFAHTKKSGYNNDQFPILLASHYWAELWEIFGREKQPKKPKWMHESVGFLRGEKLNIKKVLHKKPSNTMHINELLRVKGGNLQLDGFWIWNN